MKDRMERLVTFPITAGCVSTSSVLVCTQHGRRPKQHINSTHTVCKSIEDVKEPKDTSNDDMVKGLSKFSTLSKPDIYNIGFQRLTRTIKSLSQSLVYKEEVENKEMELEIGLPTDVKHVTHIGFDGPLTHGAKTTNGCKHLAFSEFLSPRPDSMAQYEDHVTVDPTYVSTSGMQNTPQKSHDVIENTTTVHTMRNAI